LRDASYLIVFTALLLALISCGVPQPSPTSSGGADEPEKKVLTEDEIEAVMDERLGLVDAGEEEDEEEPGSGETTDSASVEGQ